MYGAGYHENIQDAEVNSYTAVSLEGSSVTYQTPLQRTE